MYSKEIIYVIRTFRGAQDITWTGRDIFWKPVGDEKKRKK